MSATFSQSASVSQIRKDDKEKYIYIILKQSFQIVTNIPVLVIRQEGKEIIHILSVAANQQDVK